MTRPPDKVEFEVECEKCGRNTFELRLTEDMNLRIICRHCFQQYDLDLAEKSKSFSVMYENVEEDDND